MCIYKNVNGKMEVVPEEVETIRWRFREYLNGWGCNKIAKALNEKDIPTKKSGHWSSSTVAVKFEKENINTMQTARSMVPSSSSRHEASAARFFSLLVIKSENCYDGISIKNKKEITGEIFSHISNHIFSYSVISHRICGGRHLLL